MDEQGNETNQPIVMKLGGSVITDKTTPFKPRTRTIGRIAKEIGSLKRHFDIAIVHGGGSFGHYTVKNIMEIKGKLDYEDFHQVTMSMDELNRLVTEKLVKAGVPAVSLPPRSVCNYSCSSGEYYCIFETLRMLFKRGIVPVMYGDIVASKGECGPSILSGDTLVYLIASAINASKVVFLVDAPGIYIEREGGFRDIVRKISLYRLDWLINKISQEQKARHGYFDVTSGIIGKLKAIQKGMMTTDVVETIILPGEPPGVLLDYLKKGKRTLGTLIVKSEIETTIG